MSKSEFNVFVGVMSGLQTKVDALDARFTRANDDAASTNAMRKDMESQLERMRQQVSINSPSTQFQPFNFNILYLLALLLSSNSF